MGLHLAIKAAEKEASPYLKFGTFLGLTASGFLGGVMGYLSPMVEFVGLPLAITAGITLALSLLHIVLRLYRHVNGRATKLIDVVREQFVNETVRIDGNNFVDCVFDSCTLEYAGGLFRMDKSDIGDDCRIKFKTRETQAAAHLIYILSKLATSETKLFMLDGHYRLHAEPEIITR